MPSRSSSTRTTCTLAITRSAITNQWISIYRSWMRLALLRRTIQSWEQGTCSLTSTSVISSKCGMHALGGTARSHTNRALKLSVSDWLDPTAHCLESSQKMSSPQRRSERTSSILVDTVDTPAIFVDIVRYRSIPDVRYRLRKVSYHLSVICAKDGKFRSLRPSLLESEQHAYAQR